MASRARADAAAIAVDALDLMVLGNFHEIARDAIQGDAVFRSD